MTKTLNIAGAIYGAFWCLLLNQGMSQTDQVAVFNLQQTSILAYAGCFVLVALVIISSLPNYVKFPFYFILAGGLSNFTEYLVTGKVADYINFGWMPWNASTVYGNPADLLIYGGIFMAAIALSTYLYRGLRYGN